MPGEAKMKITIQDTISLYEEMFRLNTGREDFFRFQMMKPFEKMFAKINIPLRATQKGGYDIVAASKNMGLLDVNDTKKGIEALEILKTLNLEKTVSSVLEKCIGYAEKSELKVDADELIFAINIADPEKLRLQKGYCGFGGIPGYIMVSIFPNDYNVPKIPALIAHEFHHNLRFSYKDWHHGNVSVGDYLVIEGLAEAFAGKLYGNDMLGPWVTSFPKEELEYSKEILKNALSIKGFAEVTSYIFGDEVAAERGYETVGLPNFAGYAAGYQIVKSFMKNTGKSVLEATLIDAKEIIAESKFF